jgi:hypothetical protein
MRPVRSSSSSLPRRAEEVDHDHGAQGGKLGRDLGHHLGAGEVLAVVGVAIDREQHRRLDLREPVHHAAGAEVGRARGPDRADARRGQQPDRRLGDVRQQRHHPVALAYPEGAQPVRHAGHLSGEFGIGERAGTIPF